MMDAAKVELYMRQDSPKNGTDSSQDAPNGALANGAAEGGASDDEITHLIEKIQNDKSYVDANLHKLPSVRILARLK